MASSEVAAGRIPRGRPRLPRLQAAFIIGPLLSTSFVQPPQFFRRFQHIHQPHFTRQNIIRSVVVHAFLRARPEAGSMLAKDESECAKHSRGFQ